MGVVWFRLTLDQSVRRHDRRSTHAAGADRSRRGYSSAFSAPSTRSDQNAIRRTPPGPAGCRLGTRSCWVPRRQPEFVGDVVKQVAF